MPSVSPGKIAKTSSTANAVTKDANDFSVMPLVRAPAGACVVKIPAPLACYWLGLLELEDTGGQ